jgi:hypothetical protein
MTRSRDVADTQDNLGGAVAPFVAGKNKIINGDFGVNQRAFSSTTADVTFTYDRWRTIRNTGTVTYTAGAFTSGGSPAGYEFQNYLQVAVTGQSASDSYALIEQPIEDVRTFAGQTVTFSFFARATSGTPSIAVTFDQDFKSATPAVVVNGDKRTISTTWARYSVTINVPAITGATVTNATSFLLARLWFSAGSAFNTRTNTLGTQSATFQITGVQIEAGNVATPFTTASGSIGGELALCQRYYWRAKVASGFGTVSNYWFPNTTSLAYAEVSIPVPFRALPSAVEWGGNIGVSDGFNLIGGISSITVAGTTPFTTYVALTTNMSSSSLTVYRGYKFADQGAGTAFLGLSAEL